uniref:Microspherule protein 1 n=1 Tax=Anthurium amnicola TaxID=1678845 RepID=A0A1D1XLM1_9ARAE
MGALAPLPQWIPEDDLLLKNAVEAGASLESLAKGAVRFSRRFTVKELQDRWRSLLFDPEISAEASAGMIDIEIEASVSNHLKSGRTCSLRGKEWTPGKRKGDNVRSHYYAMRKRVCNLPCNSADLDFLLPPSTTIGFGGDGCCGEHLKSCSVHLDRNCIMGASMSDQFRIPKSDFGVVHDTFPEMLKVNPDAANANAVEQDFHKAHMGLMGNQIQDEIACCGGSFGFGGKVLPMPDNRGIDNLDRPFEHKIEQKENPHISGENLKTIEISSDVQDIGSPQKMSVRNLHEAENIKAEPFPIFDSENDKKRPHCSGFGEDQNLHAEVSDCSGSLHNIEFSSPLVSMSIWGGIDATSTLPMDASFDDNEQRSTPALTLPTADVEKITPAAYDGTSAEQKLHDGINLATLTGPSNIAEGDFVNLSLAFANDDELFLLNEDGKDIIDESCLDTLDGIFSDSPADIHHDNVYGSTDPRNLEMLHAHDVDLDGEYPGESKDPGEETYSGFENGLAIHDSVEDMEEIPSKANSLSEPIEGFMLCHLNTEDPEIPCNDEVILPNEVLPTGSSTRLKLDSEAPGLAASSNIIISDNRIDMEEGQEAFVKPFASSLKILPLVNAKVGLMHPSDDCRVKTELSEIDSLSKVYRKPGIAADGTNLLSSSPVAPIRGSIATLKEEVAPLAPGECGEIRRSVGSLLEKSLEGSDHVKSNFQIREDVCEKVVDSAATIQKWASLHPELGCGDRDFADPSQICSTSDQEEKISDSDDDIPNFSDIEAMILDMDLGLSDQESSLFAREVSRYQYLDTKKAIMRLEQGAQSYMQRAIASHGAFAIFYGRHLQHFIKKPKVSLGRATEDVYIDIDLKREGRANKISRNQAIIELDERGFFLLKNIGKCPIVINGKEVLSGKQLNINSGCLIEIRGMKFIFEVNPNAVSQYLANAQRKSSQEQSSNF